MLTMTPPVLTFSPVVVGNVSTETVTITNVSGAPMTLTAITPPAEPFSLSGLPAVGAVLDAGGSFIATIAYAPSMVGTSSGYFSVAAGDAVGAMAVEGSALMGGKLRIEPQTIDSGGYNIGDVSMSVFQLSNDGDVPVVIEKSKPPTAPAFQPVAPFDEGTVLAPGASIEQVVRVSPTEVGLVSDVWQLNANDGQGLRLVTFSVTGAKAAGGGASDGRGRGRRRRGDGRGRGDRVDGDAAHRRPERAAFHGQPPHRRLVRARRDAAARERRVGRAGPRARARRAPPPRPLTSSASRGGRVSLSSRP